MNQLARFFPFLRWFPLSSDTIKSDLLAGITVALVLIPQSMAYAQLAGMPAYYGLYAAFLPVIIAALWGSSAQLATGPVAVVSLLTASALIPLAVPGSADYIDGYFEPAEWESSKQDEISLAEVRRALSSIPGSLSDAVITSRDERF